MLHAAVQLAIATDISPDVVIAVFVRVLFFSQATIPAYPCLFQRTRPLIRYVFSLMWKADLSADEIRRVSCRLFRYATSSMRTLKLSTVGIKQKGGRWLNSHLGQCQIGDTS